jgi:recombination protein RecT
MSTLLTVKCRACGRVSDVDMIGDDVKHCPHCGEILTTYDATEDDVTDTLSTELERAAQPKEQMTVLHLIERQKPELEKALAGAMDVDRFARVVLTQIRRTPALLDCSPESLIGGMMLSAQLGLEPGPLGLVYLVPFKGQVEFIIGYRGYIDLAYRSGMVKDIASELVHEGDAYHPLKGDGAKIIHDPAGAPGDRPVVAAYAIARLKTGGTVRQSIWPEDWERAKSRSASGSKGKGPWVTDTDAMIRKTAVRRLEPMLPKSAVFAHALAVDTTAPVLVDDGDTLTVDAEGGAEA